MGFTDVVRFTGSFLGVEDSGAELPRIGAGIYTPTLYRPTLNLGPKTTQNPRTPILVTREPKPTSLIPTPNPKDPRTTATDLNPKFLKSSVFEFEAQSLPSSFWGTLNSRTPVQPYRARVLNRFKNPQRKKTSRSVTPRDSCCLEPQYHKSSAER